MAGAVEKVLAWILEAMTKDISQGIWALFTKLFLNPMSIFEDENVRFVQVFMTTLALGLLPLLIVLQALRLSAARAVGMNTMPPEVLVKRAFLAAIACSSVSVIVWVIITFGNSITNAFSELGLGFGLLEMLFQIPGTAGLSLMVLVLFLLIGAILLTIQKAIITAELSAMLVFGPVTGLSLLQGDNGLFNTWLRETISLVLTPVVQLVLTWLFLKGMVRFFTIVEIQGGTIAFPSIETAWESRLATFGYLYLIWKTPGWLRRFTYSAGQGDMLMQGGASVARFAVMRHMMAAAAKSVVPGGKP